MPSHNPKKMTVTWTVTSAAILLFLLPTSHHAQEMPGLAVQGPHGAAIYVNADHKAGNDQYGYAGAFRAGDFVFVSGVVAGAWEGETLSDEELRDAIRAALSFAAQTLEASGSSFDDVVEIVSFHVWDTPYYQGDKASQLDAIVDVKREYMQEPDPAWTAVGTTALVPDQGIIEIKLTAYSPLDED